jgi:hypothetical protein
MFKLDKGQLYRIQDTFVLVSSNGEGFALNMFAVYEENYINEYTGKKIYVFEDYPDGGITQFDEERMKQLIITPY